MTATQKTSEDMRFLHGNSSWKKSRGEERIHYFQEIIMNFYKIIPWLQSPRSLLPTFKGEGLFVPNCRPRGGWSIGEIGTIATIFMYEIYYNDCDYGCLIVGIVCQKTRLVHNCSGCYEHREKLGCVTDGGDQRG